MLITATLQLKPKQVTMRGKGACLVFHLTLIFLFVSCSSSEAQVYEILEKLKASLTGGAAPGLEDWKFPPSSPLSHCSYTGILCDQHFRVVSLNLSFRALSGSVPPEIGLLTDLVNLTLSSNKLSGSLPPHLLANLTSLAFFNISNNNLHGRFPDPVAGPLETLDAYNNNFNGTLPLGLVGLKKLKHLHLGGNFFSGEIPAIYSEIQSLEYLGLNGNSLSGPIPASLCRLPNLQQLYLGYYSTYQGGIPPEFGSFNSLRLLDLGSCNLSGEIPATLGRLKTLDSLFLQFNNLSGMIPAELSGLSSLKSLDLSNNELTGEIPESFSSLKQLTLLNLFRNHLYGPIPASIGDLPNLEVLQLWENNFTLSLPWNLGQNGRLRILDVTCNHLTGIIPPHLCFGGNLEWLILMNNFFIGPIPHHLGDCNSLVRVRLAKNFLNGTIPPGFFNLSLLNFLELNDNYLSGELPQIPSANSNLGSVVLSNNAITGVIPTTINNLIGLHILSLQMNRFSGEIPPQIGDLKNLSVLNISHNLLVGQIPGEIALSSALSSIDLSGNNLSGEIPKEITGLRILSTLNLSRNHLNGGVPHEIRSMQSLTTLDFSSNNLSGLIPAVGQFLVFNDTCFAGNPNLCGPLLRVSCSAKSVLNHPKKVLGHHASPRLVIITLVSLVAVLLFTVATILKTKKWLINKAANSMSSWKLTAFQRLEFTVDDVLECLKEENFIGQGGSGTVYHGVMPDGTEVAIKRLVGLSGGRSDHGFSAEIQTLGRIRHRNIVRLLGYVCNKDTNLLLYEYMPNGSLGELLHGSKGSHFEWETRYRVAVEAAKGLCYLHHDCWPLIIHRDVKSNNILLDSDYEAHVADFGLAKFLTDAGASEGMSSIAGSYGYIAPEYAYTLRVDEKSDVYSFGVVLLELITGRKPVGDFEDGVDLVRWVWKTSSEISESPSDAQAVLALVDTRLTDYPLTKVINMYRVAMLCVQETSDARPTMREVVHILTNPPLPAALTLLPL